MVEQQPAPQGLGATAARGAVQTLAGQGARLVIQLGSIVILARLLPPADFGLFGLVLAVLGVGYLLRDAGLSSAAIQAVELTQAARSNLFWLSTGIGAILSILTLGVAPLMGWVFQSIDMVWITLGMAPTFLLSGVAAQLQADLTRRMRFAVVAIIETVASGFGLAVGVLVALLGGGYWVFVAQQVLSGLLSLILLWSVSRWLPSHYDRSVNMRPFYSFGLPLLGTQMVQYLANNLDSVTIGRFLGVDVLGHYNRAMQMTRVPLNQIRTPLGNLTLSVLSRLQNDDDRFLRFVDRGQKLLAWPLLIGIGLVIVLADEAVLLALGPDWGAAVLFFQLIAAGEGFNTLSLPGSWIYSSRGYTAALLRYTIFSAVVRIVAIIIGLQWGAVGVAVAFAAAPLILWPISVAWIGRVAGLPLAGILLTSIRVGVCVAAATVCGLVCRGLVEPTFGPWLGGLVFLLLMSLCLLWRSVRRDFGEVVQTAKQILSR